MNVLDLFCGTGGFTKGLVDSKLNVLFGIDFNQDAINNYNKNFKHQGICEDLTKLLPNKFNELYNTENKTIDIIVGSPPCQSYSLANRFDINIKDNRNYLFEEYIKYLNYYKPKLFILENVVGILSAKIIEEDKTIKVIDKILELVSKKYNCIVSKLLSSNFEVPQNRKRVFIIGIRKDLNIIPYEPQIISKILLPVKKFLLPKNDIDKSYFLSEKAIIGINKKLINSKKKGYGFGAQFLDINKPSYTITSRYYKDGCDALVKYNEKEIRRLTIIELKRIQTFPDNFIFEGSKKNIIIQIGNAVPCKLAYYLGLYIKKILN
jgi:DNA (cytosine-5)-methyltransferase 1